jgi:hypothetical protein
MRYTTKSLLLASTTVTMAFAQAGVAAFTSIVKQMVRCSTHLKPHLAPGGGYAVRLVPAKP